MRPEHTRRLQAAVAHQRAGRFSDAVKLYRRVLKDSPDNFDCVYLLATLYAQQGNLKAAVDMFRRAAKMRPELVEVRYNLAVVLGLAGNHTEAAQVYRRILDLNPRHGNARNNLAASLLSAGQAADALLQYDALIALDPASAEAHNNRGMALQYLKRFDEALGSYDRAIALKPDFAEAHVNRGNVLAILQRPDDALDSYNKAIALKPDFADAHSNAGNIYCNRKNYEAALAAYDRALALHGEDSTTRSMRFYAKMQLCDWSDFAAECAELMSCLDRGLPLDPFYLMAMATSAAQQLRCASLLAKAKYPLAEPPLWRGQVYRHDKIRIAYVSADFRPHAVSYLAAGLFERHDRSRFDVTAISIGPDDGSALRRRLERAFDSFIDVRALRDDEVASLIRDMEIDILVDLNGFTEGGRTGIFAQRPAPIAVNYLGYPGTMGAGYYDYIVADRTVIPREQFEFYSEKIVWLPDSYQANDDRRRIADRTPSRAECGLPDEGFVFCCFNNACKITPNMFDIWMRLLRATAGSVLWLFEGYAAVAANLRREAEARGVSSQRLISAPRLSLEDHLARHRQADLFLDTLPYNAHTTASDALWAGLPVLTSLGSTFAGRVAASLLRAVELGELVTASLADYEALALKIAREPSFHAALKAKLARTLKTAALFDTARLTRHIEAAYATMAERQRRGEPPASFAVPIVGRSGAALGS